MSHHILDKAYRVNQVGGVAAHRVVIQAATAGDCALPSNAGFSGGVPLGVTTHAQSETGRAIAVRKAGVALAEAASAFSPGALLEIADNQGRVRELQIDPGEHAWAVGLAETGASASGDLVEVFLSIHRTSEPVVP